MIHMYIYKLQQQVENFISLEETVIWHEGNL